MALVNLAGFELMKFGAYTPGVGATACGLPTGLTANVTISTVQAHSGVNSLRCNPSAATAYALWGSRSSTDPAVAELLS